MTMGEGNQQLVADPLSFARSYQLEALEMALKDNTIVFFETGTGKTLIAIMLLQSYSHLLRKPSPYIAVFLVPTVVLVSQQSEVVALHTDLKVGKYYGEMGVGFWDEAKWKKELNKNEVLVMTPKILLNALRSTYMRLDQIKVLIFDECHNARGKSDYACIMTEFYHRALAKNYRQLPRIFGMTASPIMAKASSSSAAYWKQISELENLMHSKVFTCESDSVLTRYVPFSTPKLKLYNEKDDKPCSSFVTLKEDLQRLAEKHISSLNRPGISRSVAESAEGRIENRVYYFYLIELGPSFQYDVKPQSIVLAVEKMLHQDLGEFDFDLNADGGKMAVHVELVGRFTLTPEQVSICQQFQVKIFDLLLKRNLDKLREDDQHSERDGSDVYSYLLIPAIGSRDDLSVDWRSIYSVLYPKNASVVDHTRCSSSKVHTKNGLVCRCVLESSLVCTPHDGALCCVTGTLDGVRGYTCFTRRDKESVTYKEHFKERHGIRLLYEQEDLLEGKHIFTVHNYLHRCRIPSEKELRYSSCELPPELCTIVMSPISISTFYSFSFLPSVMHRIESLLLAANLKSLWANGVQNVEIPAIKVLEAITTKKCQEELHLESLETLGDSFLKYAATQQLFKMHQSRHEGLLSLKRERIICNPALCKLGCDRKIPGFIRTEPFDPTRWTMPGLAFGDGVLKEEQICTSGKVYGRGTRLMKRKTIADVVEALIGAYLSEAGEVAALSFMVWLGIEVNLDPVPYTRSFVTNPEMHVNIGYLESLLRYKFRDASLLVEALTHGSYMRPDIPVCYQRLEFLGDAVLDYLITVHLYHNYPSLSPGMLTDLRSASVNNDCYALSAIKAGLHKQILHLSPDLHRHIAEIIDKAEDLRGVETYGWESEMTLPKVLGDVIESLAGAIYVDCGHDKETVFRCMKPLLDPLVTLETLRLHPKRELQELCNKEKYTMQKVVDARHDDGLAYATVEVEARGIVHKETRSSKDRKLASRLACKAVLKSLKEMKP